MRAALLVLIATATASAEPAPPCEATHWFFVGALTAPAGWCWSRTAEGDDQGGVLRDDQRATIATFDEVAFGGHVADACAASPTRVAVHTGSAHGVPFRYCEYKSGHQCVVFGRHTLLCTDTPASFALVDFVKTLRPARAVPGGRSSP